MGCIIRAYLNGKIVMLEHMEGDNAVFGIVKTTGVVGKF